MTPAMLWGNTWASRLNASVDDPGVKIVIGQRVHERDLIGFILEGDPDGDLWTHLCLPAHYDPKHPFVYPDKVTLPSRRVIQGDLPAVSLALVVAGCGESPRNPAGVALPTFDVTTASAPSNDVFSGATLVTVPFSEVLNTTEATTDADDAQANASCGAPATDASVWYAFTPAADASVVIDASQSEYSAGVLVGVGTQGNLETVACGPGAVSFVASTGTTYYNLAFDDQLDGAGNGGSLSISFTAAPVITLDAFTVDRFGNVDAQTGIVTISGTYACSNGDFLYTDVSARQNVGRFSIFASGNFFEFGTCDGALRNWAATVFPQNGKFAGEASP